MSATLTTRARGYAAIATAACLWGTWSLFFRPAERLATLDPATQSVLVFGTAFVVVAPLAWRSRQRVARPARAWALMAGLGAVDAANILLFFMAMQHASLAVAVLTHYLALVLVPLAAPYVLGERITRRAWLALAAALGGLVLLLEPWRSGSESTLLGAACGAGSAIFFTCNVLGSKRAGRWFSHHELLAWRIPIAIPVLLCFVPAGGFRLPLAAYGLLLAAGLLPGALAGLLYYWGLARVPASRATTLSLLEPVVAVVIGVLVWNEAFGGTALVGMAVIFTALYATTRMRLREAS